VLILNSLLPHIRFEWEKLNGIHIARGGAVIAGCDSYGGCRLQVDGGLGGAVG